MIIEKTELNVNENSMSAVVTIIDGYIDGEPNRKIKRINYQNSTAQRELLIRDEYLTDEQKQKVITYWGDEPTVDESAQE